MSEYPVFISPQGKKYKCMAFACGIPKTTWEWYGFKKTEDGCYFGYVMGFENEFGYFSPKELEENGISLCTDPVALQEIQPPIGWKKEAS